MIFEYKTAIHTPQPPTAILSLKSFDILGEQVISGYALSGQDIEVLLVGVTNNCAIYRSNPIVVTSEVPPPDVTPQLVSILPSGQRVMQGLFPGNLQLQMKDGKGKDIVKLMEFKVDKTKYPNILYPDGVNTTTITATIKVPKGSASEQQPLEIKFEVIPQGQGTVNPAIKTITSSDITKDIKIPIIYTTSTPGATSVVKVKATIGRTKEEATTSIYLYKGYNFSSIITDTQFTNISVNLNSAPKIEDWLNIAHHIIGGEPKISCLAGRRCDDGRLVSQVIWDACQRNFKYTGPQYKPKQDYHITLNPAVVLVMLQKEQSLISTNNEKVTQYKLNNAMNAGVSSNLRDQIEYGIDRLKRWYLFNENYKEVQFPYLWQNIYYYYKDDSSGLIRGSVIINNKATYSLFQYEDYINREKVTDGGNWLFQNLWKQYSFDK